MRYSILIAHYNNYHYFVECYNSLLAQTDPNFEVIVVDDYSTDDSVNQIKALCKDDPRVKIVVNDKNQGVGYTKRKCVELASGEVCGFVDPDDALTPNAIGVSKIHFKNETVIATYSQLSICDHNLSIQKTFPNTVKIENGNSLFLNINFEVAHFFSFRKSTYLLTEGIDSSLTSAVDQDLYLKLYEKGDFQYIPEALYLYRIHDKGVSQEKSKKDKLNHNWHLVLLNTLKRRNISKIYGQNIDEINNLPHLILNKQNTFLSKFLRKLSW